MEDYQAMSGHLEDDGLDWTVHLDDESGKYFLYNNVTNETKWATAEGPNFGVIR